jgi:hypothetical protein
MLIVGADQALVEVELVGGRLGCSSCRGVLGPWGHGRERVLRCSAGDRLLRPRRARCRGCAGTHVLLPDVALLRRRDEVTLIGAAIEAAVGHLPEEHLAGAGAVQLAAPVALGDLRAFVFGDHALDLDQQPGLRVIARCRAGEEVHLDAEALELVQDQHLVGVGAREAIRAQTQDRVQRTGLGRVAQAVHRRAVQPRARVAVVDELGDDLVLVRVRR